MTRFDVNTWRYDALGQSYALGSPIPVIETGHYGCTEHTWHFGVAWFIVIPRNAGEVTLKASVDPDPECCEGNGGPTVEAEVTVTVLGEVTTLAGDPTSIPARSQWKDILPWSASEITVQWNPPQCEGTLEIAELDGDFDYVPPDEGTVEPLEAPKWIYRAFLERQTELCPKAVNVKIAAMLGDTELDRVSVRVMPIHDWLTNGHRHGPGAQQHPPDNNDFWLDYGYLTWKYGGVWATTGGGFSSVTISTDQQVVCPRFPFDPNPPIGYACTTGASVVFGTRTFTGSENQAASIIGHELLHTTGADECQAYTWEFNNDTGTGIFQCDAAYLDNVVQQMNCRCNEIGCP